MARLDTDFYQDLKTIGKIGENWFYNKLLENPLTRNVIDVGADPRFQEYDIDHIQDISTGNLSLDEIYKDLVLNNNHSDKFTAFEEKTDTQISDTRNIVYELTSHNNEGCLARSKADYVAYMGIDNNTKKIIEVFIIHLNSLRHYISKQNLQVHYRASGNDRSSFYLINIDNLIKLGIAIKL